MWREFCGRQNRRAAWREASSFRLLLQGRSEGVGGGWRPGWSVFNVVCAVLLAVGGGTVSAQENLQRIVRNWEAYRQEIQTVQLRYRRYRDGGVYVRVSRDRLNQLVDQMDLARNPDRLSELLSQILAEPPHADPMWSVVEYWQNQSDQRERTSHWDLYRDEGLELIKERPRSLLKVYVPGVGESRWGMAELNEWRNVPTADEVTAWRLHPVPAKDARKFLSENEQIELFLVSGSDHLSRLIKRMPDKSIHREIRQLDWRDRGMGILFPQVVTEAVFADGSLMNLTVSIVEQAEFNRPLEQTVFAMPLERGGTIIDYRQEQTVSSQVERDVSDVREIIGLHDRLIPEGSRSAASRLLWMLSANLALVGTIVWWRRRHSRSAAGSSETD